MIYSNVSLYADGWDQVCSIRMWFFDKTICIYFNSLFSVICNFAKLVNKYSLGPVEGMCEGEYEDGN